MKLAKLLSPVKHLAEKKILAVHYKQPHFQMANILGIQVEKLFFEEMN